MLLLGYNEIDAKLNFFQNDYVFALDYLKYYFKANEFGLIKNLMVFFQLINIFNNFIN